MIVADDLFEKADGEKLGWYAPTREWSALIGSPGF
jgi:hypothetical protein